MRAARVASKRRPPGNNARAWVSPIFAITNGLMTDGRIPSRVSVKPNRAPDSAITMSDTAHSPIPPPSAAPWTRAIRGTGQVSSASNMSAIAIASCSLPSVSSANAARIQSMSAPAQNDAPSPARTTARSCVGPSRASAANVVRRVAISVASNALWTSGRASVTRATVPSGPVRSMRRPPPAIAVTAASYGSAIPSTEVGGADDDPSGDSRQPGSRQVRRGMCVGERPGGHEGAAVACREARAGIDECALDPATARRGHDRRPALPADVVRLEQRSRGDDSTVDRAHEVRPPWGPNHERRHPPPQVRDLGWWRIGFDNDAGPVSDVILDLRFDRANEEAVDRRGFRAIRRTDVHVESEARFDAGRQVLLGERDIATDAVMGEELEGGREKLGVLGDTEGAVEHRGGHRRRGAEEQRPVIDDRERYSSCFGGRPLGADGGTMRRSEPLEDPGV